MKDREKSVELPPSDVELQVILYRFPIIVEDRYVGWANSTDRAWVHKWIADDAELQDVGHHRAQGGPFRCERGHKDEGGRRWTSLNYANGDSCCQ